MTRLLTLLLAAALPLATAAAPAKAPLVLMSNFGTRDGAVSAMKGVAYGVAPDLVVSDLTHDGATGIWEGAFRLYQAAAFWPGGTVFVSVIDPGVGTERLAVVVKTRSGRYFVGPNNGLFTFVAGRDELEEVRQIDEKVNRRPGSEASYTFHGRDVFAYTGARLAAGVISFAQVGPRLAPGVLVTIPYQRAERVGGTVRGLIPVLDVQFGNVWTNIPGTVLEDLGIKLGDPVRVRIFHRGALVDEVAAPYRRTFGEVPPGQPLVYVNSLLEVALALNQESYAARHHVASGPDWTIELSRPGGDAAGIP
jgi:S-adenosylmethionine hydrolase